ncbi:MAG: hypothetical protein IJ327_06325 [Lachnospiraceae bacterium]|nr:hypothetical protein [Lachnospiraceae bacterium]
MLPKWLQDRIAPGYRKQINTPSQYQAAAGYLRSQMQELVDNPCPDSRTATQHQQQAQEFTQALQQIEDTLPALEKQCTQLSRQQEAFARHSTAIPSEGLHLTRSVDAMDKRVHSLEQKLQAPLPDTYEDTILFLEERQQEQQEAFLQLSALKQLTSREHFPELTHALPEEMHAGLNFHLAVQGQLTQADTLDQQLQVLSRSLDTTLEKLGNIQFIHRRFLQKDGPIQLQFETLDKQVPPLLSQAAVNSDWCDLVQSWYKANNLANHTIKNITVLVTDVRQIARQCTYLEEQLTQAKARLNDLSPVNHTEMIQQSLEELGDTTRQLQQRLTQQELQLQHLAKQQSTLKEQAKRKSLEEAEHLQDLWSSLEKATSHYVSRKEAADTRNLFEQIQTILKEPYCLRTVHRSPVPKILLQAETYGQYLATCNKDFISGEMARLDTYFSEINGRSLTPAQRKAVLTEEDYVQVIGQHGFGKSFTLEAKEKYLLEQLSYRSSQLLLWKNSQSIQARVQRWLQATDDDAPVQFTDVWQQQEQLKQLFPQCRSWDILLPALELYQYLCPAEYLLTLSKDPLNAFTGQERESAETLYRDFLLLIQIYEELLTEKQLMDSYQALHLVTQKLVRGQLTSDYTHCLVDDFPSLSPLELALLRALLNRNPRTKLFCTGDIWEPVDEISYIKSHFPRLSWTHFLVQELLAAGKQFITARDYQGGYLSLTRTKGEVILLSPLDEA